MDEKTPQPHAEDATSTLATSVTPSMKEKETGGRSTRSLSPTPSVSIHDERDAAPLELSRTKSAAQAQEELNRIMTSGEGVEYPTGMKLRLISLALCLSVFLMALDNTIIATAIPKITDQFHSLPDVGWYGSAYLLTTASFQLLFGKFYTFCKLPYFCY